VSRYKQSRKGAGNPNPAPNQKKAANARRKGTAARKIVSATIDAALLEHLTTYASENDLSRSDVINMALEAYLPKN